MAFARGKVYKCNERLHIEPADEYEHIEEDVQYVMENVLQTTNIKSDSYRILKEKFNTTLLASCNCTESINNQFGLCSQFKCNHGNNYIVYENNETDTQELILNFNRRSPDVIYECNTLCSCPSFCHNRLVQFGPRKYLEIIDCSSTGKRFGLTTKKDIPKGGFICEYAGEIISQEEAKIRHRLNDNSNKMNYIICLNEFSTDSINDSNCIKTYIDAGHISNIGRYLNHSCDPNCELISIRINEIIPKICMQLDKL